jgi:ABC-type transporter Mla subunit MlaD
MSTQANTIGVHARTAHERDETLHELANSADGLAKAIRHMSRLADSAHPLIADIWRNLTRAQREITDAQEDVRTEPFTPDALDDAA